MKRNLDKALKYIFHVSTSDFKKSERYGFRVVISLLLRRYWLLFGLVISALVAAIFEGGTLGILALAVSVLVGKEDSSTGGLPELVTKYAGFLFSDLDKGEIFLVLVCIAVASQVLKNILLYMSEACQIIMSYSLRRGLQNLLTSHVLSMSYATVTQYPTGTLATVIDQSDLVGQVMGQLGHVTRAIFMSIAYAGMMFILSPKIGLVVIMVVACIWLLLNTAVARIRRLADSAFKNRVIVWRWTIEYLSAPRLVRLFNAPKQVANKIKTARDLELGPDRKTDLIQLVVPKLLEIVTVIGAGGFLVGSYFVAGADAAEVIPTLFIYVLIFFRTKPLLKAFSDFRMKIARIIPRLGIFGELLLIKPTVRKSKTTPRPFGTLQHSIQFHQVHFSYPGTSKSALKDISFEIKRGQTLALVGASGAGKSTIADLMLGLYQPTSGVVTVDGTSLEEIDLLDWRRNIGVVDQEVFLLNTSIKENIQFGRPETGNYSVQDAAKTAYAHEFIENMDCGYEAVIGDRGFKLSGGQQQRLALARALFAEPDILVLDEATSSLDSYSERLIRAAIQSMHNERTMLIIAHRLSTVRTADYIIVVDDGQILEQGTGENLLKDDTEFARLWGLQMTEEF